MSENKSVNRLFLAVVVIYLSVSLGFSTLTALVPALRGMSVYVSILLSQSLVFVPCFLYCKLKKIKIRQLVPYRKINFATIVLVVVCTYLMYPLVVVLNAISMLFSTGGSASVAEMIMEGQSLTLNLICVALVPACVEEFMFRGLIFQTYRKSRMLPAILLSAFLFGCMHMNLNQFVYAFALGVYLAFLVEATGSIFSSMIAHFKCHRCSDVLAVAHAVSDRRRGSDDPDSAGRFCRKYGRRGAVSVSDGNCGLGSYCHRHNLRRCGRLYCHL